MITTLRERAIRLVGIAVVAAAVTAAGSSIPASAASPAAAASSSPASCSPYVAVLFTWVRTDRDPKHLGYDFTKITRNRCGNPERVILTCEYVGPHAAHLYERFYGRTVRAVGAISGRVYCATHYEGNIQWSLVTDSGGGFGVYYGGAWHNKTEVGIL